MYKIFIIVLALLTYSQASATAQQPDYLIYNGEQHYLYENPLDVNFSGSKALHENKIVSSTGNWRGYIATFMIDGDDLMLSDITVQKSYSSEKKSILDLVVPEKEDRWLSWYSGVLLLPKGSVRDYVHFGYASTHNAYTLIKIENGKFIAAKEMDYDEYIVFEKDMYEAFKKTEYYHTIVGDAKNADERKKNEEFIYESKIYLRLMDFPFFMDK